MLRGSRDFKAIGEYNDFIQKIVKERNIIRQERLLEEMDILKPLPDKKYYAPEIIEVVVSKSSTVRINKICYSVPSRLIGYSLRAYVYQGEIKLYYGLHLIQIMQVTKEGAINYRHVIASLIRKPRAFENYCYKESLFPNIFFRKAYDRLKRRYPVNGTKHYLVLLQLAATTSEREVGIAIELLLKQKKLSDIETVKDLIKSRDSESRDVFVRQPSIKEYDLLLSNMGGV